MSRTTTAIASAYDRARIQVCPLSRGEIRTLTANMNGLLEPGETILTATWRISQPWGAILTAPTIAAGGRSTSATLQAGIGCAHVKAIVTTSAGRQLPQHFRIDVESDPWFQGEVAVPGGAYEVSAP